MPDDDPLGSEIDAYLGRVHRLLIAVSDIVPAAEMSNAQSLVDHGEPAEGLVQLAWAITNCGYMVPSWVVDGIREMTAELVPQEYLPRDLDEHAGWRSLIGRTARPGSCEDIISVTSGDLGRAGEGD